MQFKPPLKRATLIKRYKRFLADVILDDGSEITMHVSNTGAMTGCAEPGDTVWFSQSDNPKRKYQHSWELTQTQHDHFICVNTMRANQLVEEAIQKQLIPELTGYQTIKREVKYGAENSKIDFLLSDGNAADVYLEVKSVTLYSSENDSCGNDSRENDSSENKSGYFPDAITTRGQKHLRELIDVARQGHRAVLLFAVLHSGINTMQPARHIDKEYAELIDKAVTAGVEILAYKAVLNQNEITIEKTIPFNS